MGFLVLSGWEDDGVGGTGRGRIRVVVGGRGGCGVGEGGRGSGDEKLGGWAPTPVGWDATPIRPGV